MKIIIAPQAFKGCASATNIAAAIARGVKRALPKASLILAPVADGGDGTLKVLLDAIGGKQHRTTVTGAMGSKVVADWASFEKPAPTAVIELARICGIAKLPKSQHQPLYTSTFGVGQAIKAALNKGYRRIFVGLGGSATNDAGSGIAQALGVRFLDASGKELPRGGGALAKLKHIDITGLDPRLRQTQVIAGCDVVNPLLGPNGASAVYAPQKGATQAMVEQLEHALENFAQVVKREFGVSIGRTPHGGAAGGAAAGMQFFLNAELVSGAEWILNKIGFERHLDKADLLIVAEGRMDRQTSCQKIPLVAAKIANRCKVPVLAICGTVGLVTRHCIKWALRR